MNNKDFAVILVMPFHRNFTYWIDKRKWKYAATVTAVCVFLLFLPSIGYAQQEEDKKVILILRTTDSLYWQVKYALGKCDYIVRDDGNRDTLRTFAAKSPFMDGFTVIYAAIKGGQVELNGFYGLSQFDGWFFTHQPNQYKPIIYFKNGKAWKQLLYIASKLDYTEITYAK